MRRGDGAHCKGAALVRFDFWGCITLSRTRARFLLCHPWQPRPPPRAPPPGGRPGRRRDLPGARGAGGGPHRGGHTALVRRQGGRRGRVGCGARDCLRRPHTTAWPPTPSHFLAHARMRSRLPSHLQRYRFFNGSPLLRERAHVIAFDWCGGGAASVALRICSSAVASAACGSAPSAARHSGRARRRRSCWLRRGACRHLGPGYALATPRGRARVRALSQRG